MYQLIEKMSLNNVKWVPIIFPKNIFKKIQTIVKFNNCGQWRQKGFKFGGLVVIHQTLEFTYTENKNTHHN